MVKCLICGVEKNCSIVEHLKFEHKMRSSDYKLMFIGSQVKSNSELKKISERFKKAWSDPEYRDKQIKIRNITHKDPEFIKNMSEKIKKIHKETPEIFSGFTNWSSSEKFKKWVVSDERIKKISKTSKERWENNEYREKTIESIKTSLNDGRCKKSLEYREKMSKKISQLYADGIISNQSNKYKTGKYTSKNNEIFMYSSSYELESMELFDLSNLIKTWTNKHGIRVKYFYNGINRHYVPDFLVEFNNGLSYIIEMKGWNTEEVDVKEYYTKQIYKNYKIFYTINDLKTFINENN
jgi:hypothetical protein